MKYSILFAAAALLGASCSFPTQEAQDREQAKIDSIRQSRHLTPAMERLAGEYRVVSAQDSTEIYSLESTGKAKWEYEGKELNGTWHADETTIKVVVNNSEDIFFLENGEYSNGTTGRKLIPGEK